MAAQYESQRLIFDYVRQHGTITTAKAGEITDSSRQNGYQLIRILTNKRLLKELPYPSLTGGKMWGLYNSTLTPEEYHKMAVEKGLSHIVWEEKKLSREHFLEVVKKQRRELDRQSTPDPLLDMFVRDSERLLSIDTTSPVPHPAEIELKAIQLKTLAETYASFLKHPGLAMTTNKAVPGATGAGAA